MSKACGGGIQNSFIGVLEDYRVQSVIMKLTTVVFISDALLLHICTCRSSLAAFSLE